MNNDSFKDIAETIGKVLEDVKYRSKNHLEVGIYEIVNIYLKDEHRKENTIILKSDEKELFLTFNDDVIDSKEYKYMVIIKYRFGNINFYTNTIEEANTILRQAGFNFS